MATTQMTGAYSYRNYLNEIQPTSYVKQILLSFIDSNGVMTKIGKPRTHPDPSFKMRQKRVIDHLMSGTAASIGQSNPTPQLQPYDDYEEGVFEYQDMIQVPLEFTMVKNYVENGGPMPRQIEMYYKGLAFTMENDLINNDAARGSNANPLKVKGLKWRAADASGPNSTLNPACNFASSANMSDTGVGTPTGLQIMRDFRRMLSHLGNPRGTGVCQIGSPQYMWQLTMAVAAQSTAGGFAIDRDAFDREVLKFHDMEISECGFLPPQDGGQQITPIIDDGQDINGWSSGDPNYNSSGATYTSAYFLQCSGEDKLELWQVAEPWMWTGMVPGQFYHVAQFLTWLGIWQPSTRAFGRLYGIKVNGPTYD